MVSNGTRRQRQRSRSLQRSKGGSGHAGRGIEWRTTLKKLQQRSATAVQDAGANGRARHSVRAVGANPDALVAIGGGQRTARPTRAKRLGVRQPSDALAGDVAVDLNPVGIRFQRRQARHSCSSQNQTRFQAPSGAEYAAPTGLGNWVVCVTTKISLLTELRTGAPNQPQRGCSNQPSVGAKRLRWVNGQNENNSEGVAAVRRWI